MENLFIFDWLTITTTMHSIDNIYDLLGMTGDMFVDAAAGRYGYGQRKFCGGISILSGGFDEAMGICVEMSGQGCRDFETLGNGDYQQIFDLVLDNPDQMNITRLDIAYDERTGDLDIQELCRETLAGNWVSRWNKYKVEYSDEGTSCLFGSRQSEMYLRFYDKAAERGIVGQHWSRTELVLKRDRAKCFIADYQKNGYGVNTLSSVFWGVIANYIRFVSPNDNDDNKSRWETAVWWSRFVKAAAAVKLFRKPGVIYNLHDTENYVYNQAGNAVLTVLICRGLDGLIDGIMQRNPRYAVKYQEICKRNGVSDDITLSLEKLNDLRQYISNYRKEYGLEMLWSPEWIEDDGETPFDEEWTRLPGKW